MSETMLNTCPRCEGRGFSVGFAVKDGRSWLQEAECDTCDGLGGITDERARWIVRGQRMADERRERGMTLRREAEARGISPVTLSRMERGISEPIKRKDAR